MQLQSGSSEPTIDVASSPPGQSGRLSRLKVITCYRYCLSTRPVRYPSAPEELTRSLGRRAQGPHHVFSRRSLASRPSCQGRASRSRTKMAPTSPLRTVKVARVRR